MSHTSPLRSQLVTLFAVLFYGLITHWLSFCEFTAGCHSLAVWFTDWLQVHEQVKNAHAAAAEAWQQQQQSLEAALATEKLKYTMSVEEWDSERMGLEAAVKKGLNYCYVCHMSQFLM